MTRAARLRATLVVAALSASVAGCSAGSTEGVGSTAYERCPDALVDAWLALGRDDGGHASDLDRVPNGPGDLPVGEVRVLCSIALTHPDGGAAFTLSVLEGPGTVAEIVGGVAAEQGYIEEQAGRPGVALALVSADGGTRYELSLPGDEVLRSSGFPSASTRTLLEGTILRP